MVPCNTILYMQRPHFVPLYDGTSSVCSLQHDDEFSLSVLLVLLVLVVVLVLLLVLVLVLVLLVLLVLVLVLVLLYVVIFHNRVFGGGDIGTRGTLGGRTELTETVGCRYRLRAERTIPECSAVFFAAFMKTGGNKHQCKVSTI